MLRGTCYLPTYNVFVLGRMDVWQVVLCFASNLGGFLFLMNIPEFFLYRAIYKHQMR